MEFVTIDELKKSVDNINCTLEEILKVLNKKDKERTSVKKEINNGQKESKRNCAKL